METRQMIIDMINEKITSLTFKAERHPDGPHKAELRKYKRLLATLEQIELKPKREQLDFPIAADLKAMFLRKGFRSTMADAVGKLVKKYELTDTYKQAALTYRVRALFVLWKKHGNIKMTEPVVYAGDIPVYALSKVWPGTGGHNKPKKKKK